MIDPKRLSEPQRTFLRQHCVSRLEGLRSDRLSWWAHWARIAEVMLPRRYKWFVTPNQYNRGSQMNSAIVDETALLAARTCSSGMLAGMTSPLRPWFRLGLHGVEEMPPGPGKIWLAEVTRRMLRAMHGANFYQSLGVFYHDLATFNSASMIIYDDADQIFRCYNPCLGEFFFGSSNRQDVDVHYREYTYTCQQIVEEFGLENCSLTIQGQWKGGGAQRSTESVICHAIEPNTDLYENAGPALPKILPSIFKWREVYWEQANPSNFLRITGYRSKPFVGGRWAVTGNDAYGHGPGMDALPATLQLQIEQRRKAEAIDKLVRPPMIGDVAMRNEPASILPGAITYVPMMGGTKPGFRPAFQVEPRIQEMGEDIAQVQARIKDIFFVPLFMMISELDTVRTATEIDARREEKLIQLGPVIERFENEVLDPIIDRVFDIMLRKGLLPPPPPEIAGQDINIQYISMLAENQRAASTTAIERLLQVAGNLVGVVPDIMDNINTDVALERYADYLQVDPEIVRSIAEVMQIRARRAQERQAQMQAQAAMAMVQAGKTLSETEVGGGQNALERIAA